MSTPKRTTVPVPSPAKTPAPAQPSAPDNEVFPFATADVLCCFAFLWQKEQA